MYFKMEKLKDKLNKIKDHSLSVLCAPSGSGKTTVLDSVLKELQLNCIWINLSEEKDASYVWRVILEEINLNIKNLGGWYPFF